MGATAPASNAALSESTGISAHLLLRDVLEYGPVEYLNWFCNTHERPCRHHLRFRLGLCRRRLPGEKTKIISALSRTKILPASIPRTSKRIPHVLPILLRRRRYRLGRLNPRRTPHHRLGSPPHRADHPLSQFQKWPLRPRRGRLEKRYRHPLHRIR